MWAHWDDRFGDLWHYDKIFAYLHQARFFTGSERFAYPAPAAAVYDVLLQLGRFRLAAFTTFVLLIAVVCSLMFVRALSVRGVRRADAELFVVILCATSWPLLFLIERANIEAFVVALYFTGALAYWRNWPRTAAFFWGLAASIKIYPIVLLALFFRKRLASAAVIGFATFASALIISFWWIGPTVQIAALGTLHGIGGFVTTYADHSRIAELRWDHSYLALIKAPLSIARLHLSKDVTVISRLYLFGAGLAALVLFFTRVQHKSRLNQFVLLSIAMISLPPVSYDYTLCHLYPSFALIVLASLSPENTPQDLRCFGALLACFAIILSSENFLFYRAFHLNGPLKALALLCATVLLIRHNLPEDRTFALRRDDLRGT